MSSASEFPVQVKVTEEAARDRRRVADLEPCTDIDVSICVSGHVVYCLCLTIAY